MHIFAELSTLKPARFLWSLLFSLICLFLTASCTPITSPAAAPPTPAATQGSTTTDEPFAIITYIEGDVLLTEELITARPPGLLAPLAQNDRPRPFQPVREGATMQVGAGGRAGFVCGNGYAYGTSGPSRVVVDAATCNSGHPLPGNSARNVRPNNGRLHSYNGSAVIEGETRERESDYGQIPVIYSPRNTFLLMAAPDLAWVEVSGASEYVLSLSGMMAFADVTLTADERVCNDAERATSNRICTHPWPGEWTLAPGQRYFLTISARTGIASPLRPSEPSALRTLADEAAAQVQATAGEFSAIQTDPITPKLLLGRLYVDHELYSDAIATYEAAATVQPSPQLYVALGDLYLETDLQRFAFAAYQQALDLLATEQHDDPAVTAAAEFGIGLVYYSRANYKEAEPHLVTAVDLYRQIGADAERLAAERALAETRGRIS